MCLAKRSYTLPNINTQHAMLLLAFLLLTCQTSIAQEVYITKSGEKYHRSSCQYLKSSKIAIGLDKAQSLGYTACKVCRPPLVVEEGLEHQELSTPVTSHRCTALTQSGVRCKRMTSNSNGRCWQHQEDIEENYY